MKNRRFKDWINDIKDLIERRVEKVKQIYTDVWTTQDSYDVFTIHIAFQNDLRFSMSFCGAEHNKNNGSQKTKLAMCRRKNMAHGMRDFAEELTRIAKVLEI